MNITISTYQYVDRYQLGILSWVTSVFPFLSLFERVLISAIVLGKIESREGIKGPLSLVHSVGATLIKLGITLARSIRIGIAHAHAPHRHKVVLGSCEGREKLAQGAFLAPEGQLDRQLVVGLAL